MVRGSVHQVAVLHAPPGAPISLRRKRRVVQTATVDSLGGVLFRNVDDQSGYTVEVRDGTTIRRSAPVDVTDAKDRPRSSLYSGQRLEVTNLGASSGYGYLTTRDGTQLSVHVVLPGPPEDGPYPTVMEYSGYDPSSPTTGQPQYQLLLPSSGYAWVGVNIRGSGCSGGAFNFFESLQGLDGYDAIETIAAQPWSDGHVGMVGISYAGISQLFVGRTRPPHLDAITPVSVIDDTWRGTLYPGGVFNNGFALKWATERVEQNKWPNPDAPKWVTDRIAAGDDVCADNMLLRGQNVNLIDQIDKHPNPSSELEPEFTYDFPNGSDSLAPAEFVDQITAKVFLAGAWQDEQTGGHWANMIDRFDPDALVRVEGQNGTHAESLDPQVAFDALEFLDLYVGRRTPKISVGVRAFGPALWAAIMGVSGLSVPDDRFTGQSYESALTAYEAEPTVKLLWETGNAAGQIPGAPVPRAQSRHDAWPLDVRARSWYLQAEGGLRSRLPSDTAADEYRPDPSLRPRKNFQGGNIWAATPTYDWQPVVDGASLAYVTAPLRTTISMAGTGSVDLWISSTANDNDVQVTLSEVMADGQERYVQNGWLRLSHRALDRDRSTKLNPFHSDEIGDMRDLEPGRLVRARVALFPFAHQFRSGSRIRITVQAPGGDRPEWMFDTPTTDGQVVNVVAHDPDHPSRWCSRSSAMVRTSGRTPRRVRPSGASRAGPTSRRLPRAEADLLDSAAVSKASKRERQKQNRELARVERERMMKRQRQMKSLRTLLILLSPLVVIGIVIALVSGDDKPTYTTATIETSEGTIVVGLETEVAPVATKRFISLADRKFYDDLCIDRVATDFMIQGGSPTCDTQGGEGNPVRGQVSPNSYPIGTLAGAKLESEPPGTFDSQFFIVTGTKGEELPNDYARFGTVLSGLDVARKIEGLPVKPGTETPVDKVTIKRIRIKTTDVKPSVSTSAPTSSTTAPVSTSTTASP